MRLTIITIATAALLVPSLALAQSGESVIRAKDCVVCHASKPKIGPAFKDISAKYRGDKDAETRLIAKLKAAEGHPKVKASDAELKSAIEYILSR